MAAAEQKNQATSDDENEEIVSGKPISSWEFIDTPPTIEDVTRLLSSLPDVWGIKQVDFIEYVQPLSQKKDLSLRQGVKEYHQVWNLYFTVAGRIAMITQAAILNDWIVSFEPEEFGEKQGFVEYGDRLVYREHCHIQKIMGTLTEPQVIELGRKPGMAWVPNQGGAGAVSSNRFEKVETSARGRSIAAWGFGVIPGSGVASFDEMQMVSEGRRAEGRRGQQPQQRQPAVPRSDLDSRLRVAMGTLGQLHNLDEATINANTLAYAQRTFAKELPLLEGGAVDFSALKDGEMALFVRSMEGEVERAKAQQASL